MTVHTINHGLKHERDEYTVFIFLLKVHYTLVLCFYEFLSISCLLWFTFFPCSKLSGFIWSNNTTATNNNNNNNDNFNNNNNQI